MAVFDLIVIGAGPGGYIAAERLGHAVSVVPAQPGLPDMVFVTDSGIVVELDRDVSARQLADLLVTLERPQRMSDVATDLAEGAGLTVDDGVVVGARREASLEGHSHCLPARPVEQPGVGDREAAHPSGAGRLRDDPGPLVRRDDRASRSAPCAHVVAVYRSVWRCGFD